MGRKRALPWRWRIAGLVLLAALLGGGWAWWQGRHWMPEREIYPVQGALVGSDDGDVEFVTLQAIGADFVYLQASAGADGRDDMFADNLSRVRESDLRYGAIHSYDPCILAEKQAANFVTTVPRDADLLPPAIELKRLASECGDPIVEAGLESELTTFINQVEGHAGKPVVLKLSPAFAARYDIATRIERNLWLERDWFQPDYAGRPWTLWTANSNCMTEAGRWPLRWVVIQP